MNNISITYGTSRLEQSSNSFMLKLFLPTPLETQLLSTASIYFTENTQRIDSEVCKLTTTLG